MKILTFFKNTRYILDSRGLREGPRHLHRGEKSAKRQGVYRLPKKSIDDKKANPVEGEGRVRVLPVIKKGYLSCGEKLELMNMFQRPPSLDSRVRIIYSNVKHTCQELIILRMARRALRKPFLAKN